MTPTQVRQAEKLLVRLALIKTALGSLRDASEFRLSIISLQSGMPLNQVMELDQSEVSDLLNRRHMDARRALEAMGVTNLDGEA